MWIPIHFTIIFLIFFLDNSEQRNPRRVKSTIFQIDFIEEPD